MKRTGPLTFVTLLALLIAAGALPSQAQTKAQAGPETRSAVMHKHPQCGCCDRYAEILRNNSIDVRIELTYRLALLKRRLGVRKPLDGCHTLEIDGYVIEGHVPVAQIERLLRERPAIIGLSLPGMPRGSPGMSGEKEEPFTILTIEDGPSRVYAVE